METSVSNSISEMSGIIENNVKEILKDWMHEQMNASTLRSDLMSEKELYQQSAEFLKLFTSALRNENITNFDTPEFNAVFDFLKTLSAGRAIMGYSPRETAIFVFSLKQPLFVILTKSFGKSGEALGKALWAITILLDNLGLFSVEEFQKSREKVIKQQQQELLELSTPVAKLWDGILVLPLIGTLDSARTQLVMENLLQKIVETGSTVAIIDIAGIPMVDTLVAQHLIKTMNAAKLMGAECIVSGIRPHIAQTIVHLGISLTDVITKATLADAVESAMHKAGFVVTPVPRHANT
jgi:rsbT co-antagonist protein RsbR